MTGLVHRPTELAEVVQLMAEHPSASLVAGGTDLVPAVRSGRRPRPEVVISLRGVRGLSGAHREGDVLVVGATTTWAELVDAPDVALHAAALTDVARQLGSPATRAWATLGGSVAHRSRAMDAGPVLVACAAEVELCSAAAGTRRVSAASYLAGGVPDNDDSVLTAVRFPIGGDVSAWVKLGVRERLDTAVVSVAVVLRPEPPGVGRVVAAAGGLAPSARRLSSFEERASGRPLAEALATASAVGHDLGPVLGDRRAPDDYRRHVTGVVLSRALALAHHRSTQEPRP